MNRAEYIKQLVEKFNQNPNHPDLTDVEKTTLARIAEIETNLNQMYNRAQETKQELTTLEHRMLVERSKSEGMQDLLCLLKGIQ
jgi:hypothetical protein